MMGAALGTIAAIASMWRMARQMGVVDGSIRELVKFAIMEVFLSFRSSCPRSVLCRYPLVLLSFCLHGSQWESVARN